MPSRSSARAARSRQRIALLVGLLLCLVARDALAHTGGDVTAAGLAEGFLHPLSGLDHVLAMLAVGMWGAQLGWPAIWVLPVAFPLVMATGAVWGILGLPLPGVEVGVVCSVIVLGGFIASGKRPRLALAGCLVSAFAIFHGYAHGAESKAGADFTAYCLGFVVSTGMIHLTGIGVGFVTALPHGDTLLRVGGAMISLAGCFMAAGLAGVL
jgi:urease accessory protein